MTSNAIVLGVVFSTLIILLLIAGVAITMFIANKQRIIHDMKMAQLQLDYEKEMRTVQDEVQEQVLANVSSELHDNIGQLLTVMHIQLEQKKMIHPELSATLNPLHDTLSKATQEVRSLGRSLNSDLLEQNGLLNTMQAEMARLQQLNRFALHWASDNNEPSLQKDQRLMVYRVFQEVLNNMMKHAEAANIYIELTGGIFRMVIRDDGKGFDVNETLRTGNGSGLKNIMKRAKLAGLDCSIASEKDKGSIFTLTRPAAIAV